MIKKLLEKTDSSLFIRFRKFNFLSAKLIVADSKPSHLLLSTDDLFYTFNVSELSFHSFGFLTSIMPIIHILYNYDGTLSFVKLIIGSI
jgi:hypothetical protein